MDSDNYNSYTAIIKQDGPWWIGWIEEIPGVNCQENSYDELIESLKVTLTEALEFNREDSLNEAGTDYRVETRIMTNDDQLPIVKNFFDHSTTSLCFLPCIEGF